MARPSVPHTPDQGGESDHPRPPFPPQHLERPGLESKLRPAPEYRAPTYRGAEKLAGMVALITGGDSGIGRAVAVLFAREGADVAIVYLPVEQSDADTTRAAVSDFCRQAVERTVREFGRLDILVNNAAYQKHVGDIDKLSDEQWEHTFRTNIHAYFYMARAAMPHLAPGSAIIQCGSVTGLEGSSALLDYSATKGAIHAFTKALAQQLIPRGVRVNCVAPGPVWTPLNPADRAAVEVSHFGESTPMGRPAQPEEIAPAFVYFASAADSSYVTGEVLALLGGATTAG
jgi:NAD(P)-dependent dehydrogenase (short-subunit alcohol dehydrogenase family)